MPSNSNPVYFNCHLCGDCCSSWSIPIEAEKARILLARDWVQARLAETHRQLEPISDEAYRLPLTDKNLCVFLGADRRCMIEANEGVALKPNDCRRFPFAGVQMPDGRTCHDTSAVCRHVAEQLLAAFQPILPKPETRAADRDVLEGESLEAFRKKIPLDWRRSIPWQAYEAIWSKWLKAAFEDAETSAEQALFWLKAALTRYPQTPAKPVGFKDQILFSDWMTLCFLRKPYGAWSWFNLLRGTQYDDPRVFGLPVVLSELRPVHWEQGAERQLNAFLFSLLSRRRFLARGGSLASLLAMAAVATLLVRWYVKVLLALEERTIVESKDVALAIRLVERYYTGHQPRFMRLFLNRWRGEMLLRLLLF
jgi:Fe-S-cluster containining protein